MPEMKKDLITEISRYKELMGLENLNESVIFENFIYPSNGKKVTITSPYGMRNGKMHHGLDLRAKQGSNILAIADGVVTTVVLDSPICGGTLRIDHGTIDGKKIYSRFCHVSEFLVDVGDEVKQGQIVAKSGGTPGTKGDGRTTGPHIHFEFGINGSAVNPKQYYDEMSEWTGTPIQPDKTEDETEDETDSDKNKDKESKTSEKEKHTWEDVKAQFEELKAKLKLLKGVLGPKLKEKVKEIFPNFNGKIGDLLNKDNFDEWKNKMKEKGQDAMDGAPETKEKIKKIIDLIKPDAD
jgi:hypothetical protein